MKNKKGFTLVELLAVIVVLAIILTIAVGSVTSAINKTKEATKYAAAKEIVAIAEAYMEENNLIIVSVEELVTAGYLESDATNPQTGEAGLDIGQYILKCTKCIEEKKTGNDNYSFEGYYLVIDDDDISDIYVYKSGIDVNSVESSFSVDTSNNIIYFVENEEDPENKKNVTQTIEYNEDEQQQIDAVTNMINILKNNNMLGFEEENDFVKGGAFCLNLLLDSSDDSANLIKEELEEKEVLETLKYAIDGYNPAILSSQIRTKPNFNENTGNLASLFYSGYKYVYDYGYCGL